MKRVFLKLSLLGAFFLIILVFQIKLLLASHSLYKRNLALKNLAKELENLDLQKAKVFYNAAPPVEAASVKANVMLYDGRVANLKRFIRKYNPSSPLYELADYIVEVSDKYGLDYRLLVAIAMQESNLCKKIPRDSHNCWGWGIYGDKITRFSSYKEAIETVARGLRKNYVDKGHYTIYTIMKRYNPSSKGSWGDAVKKFFLLLE